MTRRFLPGTACVLALVPLALSADDWPLYRSPQRSAISAEKGLRATWPLDGVVVTSRSWIEIQVIEMLDASLKTDFGSA